VHSYDAGPSDRSIVCLEADHGVTFCAAIRARNVFACQFHPEKSQAVGLALLRELAA
jgi:glutamine amidotransferase